MGDMTRNFNSERQGSGMADQGSSMVSGAVDSAVSAAGHVS
jgi:hypothetical protein